MLQGLLLLQITGSRSAGSVVVVSGPAVLQHVGSSWTRDRTRVPCTGWQIANNWTAREVPGFCFKELRLC